MKQIITVLLLSCSVLSQAQLTISGQISGVHQPQTLLINHSFDCWYHKQLSLTLETDNKGRFSISVPVEKARTVFLDYQGKRMLLYVEPRKDLFISFDSADVEKSIRFGGLLKNENDFRRTTGLSFFTLYPRNLNDTLLSPHEIVASIQAKQEVALKRLSTLKNNSSAAFYTITKADIEYFLPVEIWEIIYTRPGALAKNKSAWQDALQIAYGQQPLSNDSAVNSYYYQNTIAYYDRYLSLSASGKKSFDSLLEAVCKKPAKEALQEIKDKGERFWEYLVINHALQGAALQYALASFINNGIRNGELGWLQEAYSDFVSRFPQSTYRSYIDAAMVPYNASQSATPPGMIFEPVAPAYKSLADILQKHRGRVVYIDLWGSWCGPCRDEFSYYKPLKTYFAGKPVDFVYIAFEHNRGDPEAIWKKTALYYTLSGRHILAGAELRANIDTLFAPGGLKQFPTYLLVDKEGTIRSLHAERPSSQSMLYRQIDQLLQ